MKQTTWLAGTIAMSLTVGFGARLLAGDDSATSRYQAAETMAAAEEVALAAEGAWTMPGITVVMKVPAKADEVSVPSSTSQTLAAGDEAVTETTWTMPGITVVVRVPAKADDTITLPRSAGQTLAVNREAALEETVEGTWTMPGITVVVKVPARADRAFAFDGSANPSPRRAPAGLRSFNRDGRVVNPSNFPRVQRRFDPRDIPNWTSRRESRS